MPDLASAALYQQQGRALVARRRRPPFASQWTLPMTVVREDEAAEEALRRHTVQEFGVGLGGETFVETLYLVDPDDQHQYVANIFRIQASGPMRFNADGDYDDVRWLAPADLEQLWMPPELRAALIKILTEAPPPDETGGKQTGEAVPLAEQDAASTAGAQPAASDEAAAPDNKAGWDAISSAYQREFFGERYGDRFMWSWTLSEDDLHLLDDVRGKRVIVLGCGGGQDVVALDRMGAIAVGIDQSEKQIEYAREFATRHNAVNGSFVVGTVEDLSRFDDGSFDAAVSAHMLNYVERIEQTLRETARVLKPGGSFALSVRHPADAMLSDQTPYRIEHSYWSAQHDWSWTFEGAEPVPFRQWFWSVAKWFDMLAAAGFAIERIIEPEDPFADGNDDGDTHARSVLVPYTLIFKARKR
jgi:ubiquinone/menaquinone biosynthesis C-methylase UbiE/ADP-ribose pyrophosphatase YjhB (NUDIX family)